MKEVVIEDRRCWRVTSIGNGWAYRIEDKRTGQSVWLQDDDALRFRDSYDTAWNGHADGTIRFDWDTILDWILDPYFQWSWLDETKAEA